jgi:hypothetical protein
VLRGLQAAVAAFKLSAERAGVPPPAALHRLQVEVLLQQGQAYQALQLAAAQAGAAASSATAAAAAAAEASGSGGGDAPTLARLRADAGARAAAAELATLGSGPAVEARVRALLGAGKVVQAARLACEVGAPTVAASEFLQAAAAAGDAPAFAAVYRAFATPAPPGQGGGGVQAAWRAALERQQAV